MHVAFTSVYEILSLHYSVVPKTETKALSQIWWYHDSECYLSFVLNLISRDKKSSV